MNESLYSYLTAVCFTNNCVSSNVRFVSEPFCVCVCLFISYFSLSLSLLPHGVSTGGGAWGTIQLSVSLLSPVPSPSAVVAPVTSMTKSPNVIPLVTAAKAFPAQLWLARLGVWPSVWVCLSACQLHFISVPAMDLDSLPSESRKDSPFSCSFLESVILCASIVKIIFFRQPINCMGKYLLFISTPHQAIWAFWLNFATTTHKWPVVNFILNLQQIFDGNWQTFVFLNLDQFIYF